MKDATKHDFEAVRKDKDPNAAIQGCLKKFYKSNKKIGNTVCKGLTYGDVIDALLLGRDAVRELDRRNKIDKDISNQAIEMANKETECGG